MRRCSYKKAMRRHRDTGRRPGETEAEIGMIQLPAKEHEECRQPPETPRGRDVLSPEAAEGTSPC